MARRTFLIPVVFALALAACAESPQNTGAVSGSGGNQSGQSLGSDRGRAALTGADALRAQLQAVGDRVLFVTNSSTLDTEGKNVLRKQAAWLNANPAVKLLIEGHADERGTREYNLALGDRRAQAVRTWLTDNGIASGRLRIISYGKERPVAVSSDESSWAQNRRAVSVLDQ